MLVLGLFSREIQFLGPNLMAGKMSNAEKLNFPTLTTKSIYLGVIDIQEFKNQLYFLKFSPQDGEKGQKVVKNGRNYTGL